MSPFLTSRTLTHSAIAHGFFGRQGGVSGGIYESLNLGLGSKDDRASVMQNREIVAKALGAGSLLTLYQHHSADAVIVTKPWRVGKLPKADAMVTKEKGIALGILTADCAPVLFADPQAGVIGAAHAGWKGAFGGVIENTVVAMKSLGSKRENIAATIGPCIHQKSYEVGAEFRERLGEENQANAQFFISSSSGEPKAAKPGDPGTRFAGWDDRFKKMDPRTVAHAPAEDDGGEAVSRNDVKHLFDLPGYVASKLAAAGIAQIETLPHDTCAEEENFFSYRRATLRGEPDYGRQVSAIMMK